MQCPVDSCKENLEYFRFLPHKKLECLKKLQEKG